MHYVQRVPSDAGGDPAKLGGSLHLALGQNLNFNQQSIKYQLVNLHCNTRNTVGVVADKGRVGHPPNLRSCCYS
jgi:hypothetical protein